jgi:hypothetical protein
MVCWLLSQPPGVARSDIILLFLRFNDVLLHSGPLRSQALGECPLWRVLSILKSLLLVGMRENLGNE